MMNKIEVPLKAEQARPAKSVYVTGFCSVGAHEGVTLLSQGGALIRSCAGEYMIGGRYGTNRTVTCTCSCHDSFNEIRKLMKDMQDAGVGNDTISAVLGIQETPTPTGGPTGAASSPTASTGGGTGDRAGLLPFDRGAHGGLKSFKPTPTGRAARGQLEEDVRKVVAAQHKLFDDMLTPGVIAKFINAEDPPSQGAVHAVLSRWEQRSWVTLKTKPVRLGVITEAGKRNIIK